METHLQEHNTRSVYTLGSVWVSRSLKACTARELAADFLFTVPYLIVSQFLFGFIARQLKMIVRLKLLEKKACCQICRYAGHGGL